MRISAVLLLLGISGLAAGASSDDYYKASRANDLAQLKSLVSAGNVNVKDRRGATPLMYAASVGSVDAVKLLLAAGADAKVRIHSMPRPDVGHHQPGKCGCWWTRGGRQHASKQGMTPL
jgi:ankyrin repeat protein